MKEYKTKKMQVDALLPTQLDILRILNTRSISFSNADQYLLNRLERGAMGEETVYEFIKEFGQDHWVVLRNIWINYSGEQEYDLILLTSHACYIFEIKNYNHLFTLEDGFCKIDGQFMDKHIVTQTIRCRKNLMQIFERSSLDIQVTGILVFIGEHSRAQINDPITEIDILLRNELRDYIQMIVIEEKNAQESFIPINKIMRALKTYEIRNPHPAIPVIPAQLQAVKAGFYCPVCQSFKVDIRRNRIICSCGVIESKEEAVVRSICEYGALNFASPLRNGALRSFMANQISHKYLRSILNRHFTKVANYSHSYYINKMLPYSKLRNQFTINQPLQMTITDKNNHFLKIMKGTSL